MGDLVLEGGTTDSLASNAHEGLDITRHKFGQTRGSPLVVQMLEHLPCCPDVLADGGARKSTDVFEKAAVLSKEAFACGAWSRGNNFEDPYPFKVKLQKASGRCPSRGLL